MNASMIRALARSVRSGLWLAGFLVGSSLSASAARPAGTDTATPASGQRFATVVRIRGAITATGLGSERKLREGDAVFIGERLIAPPQAEAILKTGDAGMVAIRPGTEFVAERFAAEDKPTDGFTMRLFTGSLRVISGWIARTNSAGHTVVTPSAIIGIRGTDHEPYVLSATLAAATANKEGTYDKVNRGGTVMQVGENRLDIDAGRVGFVRAPAPPPRKEVRERALLTLLMPVLLDKVPDFYVPGEFEAELDRFSQTADQESQKHLEQRRTSSSPPSPIVPLPAPPKAPIAVSPAPTFASAATPAIVPVATCEPTVIARAWLEQLDGAIARRDAAGIIILFAPEAVVRATVRGNDGTLTSIDIGRDELAKSTLAALKGLENYTQRRVWTRGAPITVTCDRISLESLVIEQGRQAGKPYRFEALERYELELRTGKWLAIKAETTQQ